MGIKNAAPAFTQMIIVLEKNWKRRYQLDMPKYINIVIDIMRKLIKGEPVMHLDGLESKIRHVITNTCTGNRERRSWISMHH